MFTKIDTSKMLASPNSKTFAILIASLFTIVMILGPSTSSFQSVSAHYGVNLNKCEDNDNYYHDHKHDCDRNFEKHDKEDDYCNDKKDHDHHGHDNGDEWCDDHVDHNGHDHNKNNNNGNNRISQSIAQSQSSSQNSQIVSGGNTAGSGNNINIQGQQNTGNNVAVQK